MTRSLYIHVMTFSSPITRTGAFNDNAQERLVHGARADQAQVRLAVFALMQGDAHAHELRNNVNLAFYTKNECYLGQLQGR